MRDPLILPLTLTGWRHSIHTAIVRLTLAEKGVAVRFTEVDPFRTPDAAGLSPFGMVPVLRQGDFTLYETGAICRWIDEGFPGPALQPGDPKARARMAQALADLHLAPMFAGFTRSPDGAAAVAGFPALHSWWLRQAKRPHLATCLAPLPDHKPGPAISNGI